MNEAYTQFCGLSKGKKWPEVLTMFDTVPASVMDSALVIPGQSGQLLIWYPCMNDAPAEVIQIFIDKDNILYIRIRKAI